MALLERNILEIDGSNGSILFDVDPESEHIMVKFAGKETKIKRMDLWGMVYAIMGEIEQEKMTPVRKTEVQHYDKEHLYQLKKDAKKGTVLRIRCHLSVPLTVVEGLKGMVEKEKKVNIGIPIIGA